MFLQPNSNQYQYYCLIVINQKKTVFVLFAAEKGRTGFMPASMPGFSF